MAGGLDMEIVLCCLLRVTPAGPGDRGRSLPLEADWLRAADRREVARRATRCGYSSKQIAALLGVTPRTVFRYRAYWRTTDL